MTLEAWVFPTALGTATRTVIYKERSGGLVYGLFANNASSRPFATVRIGSTDFSVTGPSALPLNAWTHLAVTFNGSALVLYVNGAPGSNPGRCWNNLDLDRLVAHWRKCNFVRAVLHRSNRRSPCFQSGTKRHSDPGRHGRVRRYGGTDHYRENTSRRRNRRSQYDDGHGDFQ